VAGGVVRERQLRQCEAATEDQLAARLEKVTERLATGASNLKRPGADLIAFHLSPGRLPVQRQWSREHGHTQRRLCERFAVPVIGAVIGQGITAGHMQQILNGPVHPRRRQSGPGDDLGAGQRGDRGRVLVSARLARVHWQAGTASCPPPRSAWRGIGAVRGSR
jgi:hypothetical protein